MTEATIQDQLELERRMITFGIDRHRAGVEKAVEANRGADVQYAQKLMKEFVDPVAQAIQDFVAENKRGVQGKFRGLLKLIDPNIAAYLGLRAVFDFFAADRTLASLGQHIGMLLEDELKFSKFQEEYGAYYDTLIRDFKRKGTVNYKHMHRVLTNKAKALDVSWVDWTIGERLNVGIKLLDLIMQSTNLIERAQGKSSGKGKSPCTIVRPTEECLAWVRKYEQHVELLSPDRLPMIIPPDDWTAVDQGGYYSPQLRRRTSLVKARTHPQLQQPGADMQEVMRAVNTLQRTAWAVNTRVLDVLKEAWQSNVTIGLPQAAPYEIPVCPLPQDMVKEDMSLEDKETLDNWKAEARVVHSMNKERVSKCFQVSRVMRMANEYRDHSKFWYVYQCDFRGRLYAAVHGMSPQGPDFAKAVLQFAEGKPLGERGVLWFKVHGANTYGNDKVSYKDRAAWVDQNSKAICAVADSPFDNREFWEAADKPWQFLAFCIEYKDYIKHGNAMISHLPIALDGSCNGLQNFSAMLRDSIGGAATNLSPSDLPADIYSSVAKVCTSKILASEDDLAGVWKAFIEASGGTLPRSLAKRPVMTLPYGSTQQSCREYIYKYMLTDAPEFFPKEIRFKLSVWLTPLLWASIGEVVVAARAAMSWIQTSAGMVAKEGHPLVWVTPLGFPVLQDRKEVQSKQIETQLAGRIRIRINEETTKTDVMRQRLGASPNFVHSMDACHLMMTLLKAKDEHGIQSFACIHDDYGTHACDTDSLHTAIRKAFVGMYSNHDPLQDFKKSQEQATGIILPDLPPTGSLDINSVLASKYFFG